MKSLMDFIQRIVTRVDRFSNHRIVLAVMMLYQGAMLLLHPGTASEGMAKGIAVSIALAAAGILAEKELRKREGWKAVLFSVLGIAVAVYFYLRPAWLAGTVRYLMAFSVLFTGLANLGQTLHLEILLKQARAFREDGRRREGQTGETPAMVEKTRTTFETEITKRLAPTRRIFDWFQRSGWLSWLTGLLMTGLGIFLLVYSIEGHALISVIAGVVMVTTSVIDLVHGIQLYRMNRQADKKVTDETDEHEAQK